MPAIPKGGPTPGTYNFCVIVLDDVGVDIIGCYGLGSDLTMTPKIDLLAKRGIRIQKGWAMPTCSATRSCIQTGRMLQRTGMGSVVHSPNQLAGYGNACAEWELPASEITIAHRLSTIGYKNGWFGKVHLGHPCPDVSGYDFVRTRYGYDRYMGWPFNYDPRANGVNNTETKQNYLYNPQVLPGSVTGTCGSPRIVDGVIDNGGNACPGSLTHVLAGPPTDYCSTYDTTQIVDDAINWIGNQVTAKQPFFAYVATHAIHTPLGWPPYALHNETANYSIPYPPQPALAGGPILEGEFFGQAAQNLDPALIPVLPWYRAMVKSTDKEIGRLIDSLPANTIIILIGDNGSADTEGSDGHTVRAPFNPDRSKTTVYEGGAWVPFIIAGAVVNSPNRAVNRLAHCTDIYQTVMELSGFGIDNKAQDGVSLVPYLVSMNPGIVRCSMLTERFEPICDPATLSTNAFTIRYLACLQATGSGSPGFKLLRHPVGAPVGSAATEMYDLNLDPFEANNLLLGTLTAEQQSAFNALMAKMTAYCAPAGLTP